MKIALVGNGLEIEFQKQLTKENMIKNALEGKLSYNGVIQKSNYPSAIKAFADNHELSYENIDKNLHRWKWLEEVLKSESSNKSIEDLFMDIETALQDSQAAAEFKSIFLKYIEYFSSEVKSDFFEKEESRWNYQDKKYHSIKNKLNFLNEKFRNYDLILTTNYTDFIEKNLSNENKGKLVHLHGEFDNQENLPLLGGDKFADSIMLKVEKNIIETLKKIKDEEIDLTKIELDIFGWSFSNEHDLIQVIINIILDWYYRNSYFKWAHGTDTYRNNKKWEFLYDESQTGNRLVQLELKVKIKINYYYYSSTGEKSNDVSNAKDYVNDHKDFWKGIEFLGVVTGWWGEKKYCIPTISNQKKFMNQGSVHNQYSDVKSLPEKLQWLFIEPIKFETYPYTNFNLTNNDLTSFKDSNDKDESQ